MVEHTCSRIERPVDIAVTSAMASRSSPRSKLSIAVVEALPRVVSFTRLAAVAKVVSYKNAQYAEKRWHASCFAPEIANPWFPLQEHAWHRLFKDFQESRFHSSCGLTLAAHTQVDLDQTPIPTPAPVIPTGAFNGEPVAVPGTVEAEEFDFGGEGVGYSDTDPGNNGGVSQGLGIVAREVRVGNASSLN